MKIRFQNNETLPVHLIIHCNQTHWPRQKSLKEIWEYAVICLQKALNQRKLKARSAVLMSNHLHSLITPHTRGNMEGVVQFTEEFLNFVYSSNRSTKEQLRSYSLSFRTIHSIEDYKNAFRYILRNPIEANLVQRAEWYKYSSLYRVLGNDTHLPNPFLDDMSIINSPISRLAWINQPTVNLNQ